MAAKKDDDDDKKKKKGADVSVADKIMASGVIRATMAKAKRGDPVNCAIAVTKDKEGVILVDKKRKGKKLFSELKGQAKEAGAELMIVRFGKAVIDPETDAALVTFVVNKDAGGAMRKPILDRLKECGYSKVEFIVDANLESEPEEDEAAEAAGAAAGAAAGMAAGAAMGGAMEGLAGAAEGTAEGTAEGAAAGTAEGAAAGTAEGAAAGAAEGAAAGAAMGEAAPHEAHAAPAAPKPAAQDQSAKVLQNLMIKLMGLGGQLPAVIAAAPDLKGTLVQMTEKAKAAIVAKDVEAAHAAVDALEAQLKDAGKQAAAGQSAAAQKLDTAHKAWDMFLTIADKQKDKLLTEVSSAYQDHGFGAEVERFFKSQVEPAIGKLRQSDLTGKLAAAKKAADAAERRKLLSEGVEIVKRLQATLSSDPVLIKLDDNPFTPLGIKKAGNATLTSLQKTLEAAIA